MKPPVIFLLLCLLSFGSLNARLTIEDCVTQAEANYPLIKKFNLNDATARIDLSDINRSWLPRIGVYGQATVQNVVPSFPAALKSALDQMGQEMRGLGKLQYKLGADLSQMIYDGGASKARRDIIRTRKDVKRATLEVEMYAVRERVENLFFAILLCDEQIAQNEITRTLLQSNADRLRSMVANGTAMQSDLDMVEAQLLTVGQFIIQAQSAVKGYKEVLALYIGERPESIELIWPEDEMPLTDRSDRPELRLFNRQLAANEASNRMANTALMPKIGFFAQAYYGYPGIDYFQSMINRDLSFNILAGVKVSWNIDSFYTRKNSSLKTRLNADNITADRELFIFNSNLLTASQTEAIEGLRKVIKDDERIIALRANVRRAAESQLENGVIDATALLTKISDENLAQLNSTYHKIQLLQEIYKLKYTLNQ